jgi:hypothetical protein
VRPSKPCMDPPTPPSSANPSLSRHSKTGSRTKSRHSGSVTCEPVCMDFSY